MSLKEFWKDNKKYFWISCGVVFILGLFVTAIQERDVLSYIFYSPSIVPLTAMITMLFYPLGVSPNGNSSTTKTKE